MHAAEPLPLRGRNEMKYRRYKKPRLNRSRGGTIVVFAFLTVMSVFMVLPIVYTVVTSLKPLNELFLYPPRFFVRRPTLDNFTMMVQLVQDMWVPFERYLFNSLFVSFVGTGLYIIVASMAAFPLSKLRFRYGVLYYQIIVWAILFRPEVTRIPQYVIIARLGMINTYWSIILPVLAGSFGVFLMRQFMLTIPDEIMEAAQIDGVNHYNVFIKIVMPIVKPAWLTLIIFTFQQLWNTTGGQYIYEETVKMLPTVLQQISTGGIARAGAGAVVALILMIPPIAVFILSQSSVMETMAHSGIK
jgi:putative chitobiose transport system permease protein